jgi:hypothetical protein
MIERTSMDVLRKFAAGYLVLAVTGPRQSGKTTLVRATFPDKPYVSLEDPDQLESATEDYFRGLKRFSAIASGARVRPEVIYAGEEESTRDGIPVRPWRALPKVVAASLR